MKNVSQEKIAMLTILDYLEKILRAKNESITMSEEDLSNFGFLFGEYSNLRFRDLDKQRENLLNQISLIRHFIRTSSRKRGVFSMDVILRPLLSMIEDYMNAPLAKFETEVDIESARFQDMFPVFCPHCNSKIAIIRTQIGRSVFCSECGHKIEITVDKNRAEVLRKKESYDFLEDYIGNYLNDFGTRRRHHIIYSDSEKEKFIEELRKVRDRVSESGQYSAERSDFDII